MSDNKSTGAGKGDSPRLVSKKKWDENYDSIKWNHKKELTCDECGIKSLDVWDTCCPFDEQVLNKKTPVHLCENCYLDRQDQI
jgi:hypothetical protein